MTMPKFDPVAHMQLSVEEGVGTYFPSLHKPEKYSADWWRFDPLYTLDQLTEAYEAGKREQADELEAARAEIERKMSAADFILKERDALQADRDEWKASAEFSYRQRDELNRLCEFNEKTMSALLADNARLREAMGYVLQAWQYDGVSDEHGSIALEAESRLTTTAAQSLARIRNQVRTECAELIQDQGLAGKNLAYMILDTKEPE